MGNVKRSGKKGWIVWRRPTRSGKNTATIGEKWDKRRKKSKRQLMIANGRCEC